MTLGVLGTRGASAGGECCSDCGGHYVAELHRYSEAYGSAAKFRDEVPVVEKKAPAAAVAASCSKEVESKEQPKTEETTELAGHEKAEVDAADSETIPDSEIYTEARKLAAKQQMNRSRPLRIRTAPTIPTTPPPVRTTSSRCFPTSSPRS